MSDLCPAVKLSARAAKVAEELKLLYVGSIFGIAICQDPTLSTREVTLFNTFKGYEPAIFKLSKVFDESSLKEQFSSLIRFCPKEIRGQYREDLIFILGPDMYKEYEEWRNNLPSSV